MTSRSILLAPVLAGLLALPALAQETPSVDLVAAVFIGFAADATVAVASEETAVITQDAPGVFTGATASGGSFSFSATEPEPCMFDGEFSQNGELFAIAINLPLIEAIRFADPQSREGYTRYRVTLEGPEGMVQTIAPDGSRNDAGRTSPIGTSIPVAELDAAAASLLERCAPA